MLHAVFALALLASTAIGTQPPVAMVTLPPTAKTLGEALASIQAQTGLTLTTTLDPRRGHNCDHTPYSLWELLDRVARQSGGRFTMNSKGRAACLDTDPDQYTSPKPPVSIDGAFRIAVKQIASRRDFDTRRGVTEVTLEVLWDPRLPVFRIDSEPRGRVRGNARTGFAGAEFEAFQNDLSPSGGKQAISGSAFTSIVRIPELVRAVQTGNGSQPVTAVTSLTLTGKFTVTAAAKMLQFRVADTSKPTTLTQEGVTFTLQTPRKVGDRWDLPVELVYPPSKVEFESFEAGVWLSQNRLQLIDSTGKPLNPMNEDFRESPGKANLVYRFPTGKVPADRAGWSLVYETPSPLVEFDVAFTLNTIPLP